MKTIASWIFESLAVAAVVVLCLGLPSALDLPIWTLALTAIPMLFYLLWRLDRERFSWRFTLLMAVVLGASVVIYAYVLPRSWSSVSPFVIVIGISILASYMRRKREERNHVA
jgi:hypothetical protein